ncbi:MAG TPA: serine hydrolase domain-containing protein [Stellaceae bacterium]|nr:serine hydrolase domain-containing protein [Stellaceae bacterium]
MELSRRAVFGVGGGLLASRPFAELARADAGSDKRLPPDLRQSLLDTMARLRVPGLAVAAVRRGEPVVIDALGFASLPFRVPADERTLFHMGSVGKHFTAALVVRLAASGRIALDDPIGKHLKDVPAAFAACPIRSLLSHTSGIPTYDDLPGMEGDRKVLRADFMKAIGALPLDFVPGDCWAYSNTGFVLLGRMVEDITGRTYRQAVTEELLRPVGLVEGRVDDAEAIIAGRAEPYVEENGEVRHGQQMEGDFSGWPDGGIILSARDAASWEIGLQKGAPVPIAQMIAPVMCSTGRSSGYGFAWFLDRMGGSAIHYHSGSVSGFIAFWLRLPAHGIGVAAMVNFDTDGARTVRRKAVFELAERLAPGSTCWSLTAIRDDDRSLTERTRKLISEGAKPGDASVFAPEIARLRNPKAFDQATGLEDTLNVESGRFALVERYDEPGGAHIRRYRATLPDGPIHYDVGYDATGRIFRIRSV